MHYRDILLLAARCTVLLLVATRFCPTVFGQEVASDTTTSERANSLSDSTDELDKLLDMADKDVAQLATVRVTAPALQTEVSTVSRQTSTVGRSPAAVFVISNEMIRRSGARSIPEVLRMAPGVQVARIDASKWAVSIRGANDRFANKLLVQIDGRTVYTPLFGGVFWDVQDVVLEDVERIEVIRGPGASVWGANAVNGIINIITKNAKDTHGGFVEGGSGTEERGFVSARYGWRTANNVDIRFYGKWFERDEAFIPGRAAADDWRMGRGGFRADWMPNPSSKVTLQGDVYEGVTGRENIYPDPLPPFSRLLVDDAKVAGGNSLFRFTRLLSPNSDWSVQVYYDHTERDYQQAGLREDRDTVDVDFQHRFAWRDKHAMIWGIGYRNSKDRLRNTPFILGFEPDRRADDLFSYFLQDEITLVDERLYLTLGSKFVHSDYTPFELQPTARLLWTPSERHSIWASYSRAVRLPTRAADDVRLVLLQDSQLPGVFPLVLGNRGSTSENLDAWEAGIRVQPNDRFSWDLAGFFFKYDKLQLPVPGGAPFIDPGPPPAVFLPMPFTNLGVAESYGCELAANYELNPSWRLFGTYSFLSERGTAREIGNSPRNQLYLQSSWDLRRDVQLDLIWRYVDNLSQQAVPNYNVMDLRLAWSPTRRFECAVVARNLLDDDHPEFGTDRFTGNIATNVQREVFGIISWKY